MKYLIITIACFIIGLCQAQIKIVIEGNEDENKYSLKVTEYTQKIDSIVKAEKQLMSKEIDAVNVKVSNGVLSEEEGEKQKEEIATRYAEKIDQLVIENQVELEAIIDDQVNISLYGLENEEDLDGKPGNRESVEFQIGGNKKRPYKRIRYMIGNMAIGFSNLTDGWNLGSMNQSDLKFGKSVDVTFGPLLQYQPTITSPFTLITGLNFRSNNLRATGDNFFTENADGEAIFAPAPYERLKKAKLRTNSLFIPIGTKFSFNKKKYDEDDQQEYRNVRKGVYIGLLFYGGLNLSSKSIVKYYNDSGNKRKDKNDMESVNDLMYGMEFNFGFRGYNFYMRKDLSDYFAETTFPVNNGIEFGMRVGF